MRKLKAGCENSDCWDNDGSKVEKDRVYQKRVNGVAKVFVCEKDGNDDKNYIYKEKKVVRQ